MVNRTCALLHFLPGRKAYGEQSSFDLRTNRDRGYSFNIANALDLNRNVLLSNRGDFDWHRFSAAATSASGAGGCRFVAQEPPQHHQQNHEHNQTDNLDNARARLIRAANIFNANWIG